MKNFFFITLLAATTLPIFSQVATQDSVNLLKVYNHKKNKYILLEEGEQVAYRTVGQQTKKTRRGKLLYILDSDTLVIGTRKVAINDLDMIMSITHKKAIKAKNLGIAAAGAIALIAGGAMITLNETEPKVIGTVGIIAGFSALVSAIIPLSHSNHYSLKKGWRFKRVKTVIEDEDYIYQHY